MQKQQKGKRNARIQVVLFMFSFTGITLGRIMLCRLFVLSSQLHKVQRKHNIPQLRSRTEHSAHNTAGSKSAVPFSNAKQTMRNEETIKNKEVLVSFQYMKYYKTHPWIVSYKYQEKFRNSGRHFYFSCCDPECSCIDKNHTLVPSSSCTYLSVQG